MKSAKPPLWTKNFIFISLTCFFLVFSYFLTVSTVAVYAIEDFNASENMAGLASSIFLFGLVAARLFTGKYLETIGRNKLTYIGLSLSLVLSLLYIPITNLELFIVVRFIHGIMVGFALSSLQTAVIDIIPIVRRGEGLSYFSISYILGTATGPFAGILIVQHTNMTLIFTISALAFGAGLLLSVYSKIPEADMTEEQLDSLKGFRFNNFFERNAMPIALLMGCIGFSYSSITTFLTTYSAEIGLMTAASLFFIVFSLFNLLSRPINGKLFDSKGANIVMYPSIALFATGFVLISQAATGWMLLLGAAIMGAGYGNLHTSSLAIAIQRSPRHRVALANSTFFISMELFVGIGPFILGYFIPIIGYRQMYFGLAIFVTACLLLYYFVHGNRKEYNKKIAQDAETSSMSQ